jgi:hypothetical protein
MPLGAVDVTELYVGVSFTLIGAEGLLKAMRKAICARLDP